MSCREAKNPICVALLASLLAGCGTEVPGLLEPGSDHHDEALFVAKVVRHIHCSLQKAIRTQLDEDLKDSVRYNHGRRQLSWIYSWGAQINITLTVEEKDTLNASIGFPTSFKNVTKAYGDGDKIVTSRSRNIGLSGTASSDATRTDKIYSFYTIKQLVDDKVECERPFEAKGFSFLEGDLGLGQWISNVTLLQSTGDAGYPGKLGPPFNQNVLSYEVKFDVLTVGGITPAWKLVDVAANQGSGTFLEGKRERTHDLTITLGPTQSTGKGGVQLALTPLLASAAADFGTNVATSISAIANR